MALNLMPRQNNNLNMLTPEELIEYKKKPVLTVLSLGQKESEFSSDFDNRQLEMKLNNIEEFLKTERVKMMGQLAKGVWRPDVNKAEILTKVGPFWDTIGHIVDSKLFLYPEEALYLIDIGALELTFNNVPISVQRGYFLLLNQTGISLEFYRIYSHLSLMGYKVLRHCSKNVLTKYERDLEIHKIGIKLCDVKTEKFHTKTCNSLDDNVLDVPEDSEAAFLQKLRENGPKENLDSNQTSLADFDVFQPKSTKFRKSTVQLPDFRIQVFKSSENVPEIDKMQNSFPDQVPLIMAIVYPDVITFLQISSISLPILK